MTDTQPELIRPVLELFNRNVSALWATTYTAEIELLAGFLIPRLGDPPLNLVVMTDHQRLATTLDRAPLGRDLCLGGANRDWLLRGLTFGGGRFHPKSYLAVTPTKAVLLVGSGNLSTRGIDQGREVFSKFTSGNAEGDAAIASWIGWIRRLVERSGDTALAGRFRDLLTRTPPAAGLFDVSATPLLHNLDTPLADQFIRAVSVNDPAPVDELIVTAPYFDRGAAALAYLVGRLRPRHVHVYVTSSTSVDGSALRDSLAAGSAEVTVHQYDPDAYTHAKLIGVTSGGRGWLLSGSANISKAALTLNAAAGNVELGVLTHMSAVQVRATFLPPETTAQEVPTTALAALTYQEPSSESAYRVRLQRAAARPDGRVDFVSTPEPEATWLIDDGTTQTPILISDGAGTSQTTVAGELVRLADLTGACISNAVIVDDPQALDQALRDIGSTRSTRPPELLDTDMQTAMGQALGWLHEHLVMDVAEAVSSGAGGSEETAVGTTADDVDDDLWERLQREELGRDPRIPTYKDIAGHGQPRSGDAIADLIDVLRGRTPSTGEAPDIADSDSILSVLRRRHEQRLSESTPTLPEEQATPRHWTTPTRIRVRVRNLLMRWAVAQSDPRLVWIDPAAPAVNFTAVAKVLLDLWLTATEKSAAVELRTDDLRQLWLAWLTSAVGTGHDDGWWHQAHADGLEPEKLVGDELPQIVAALCWFALRGQPRTAIIAWQATLVAAWDAGLVDPTTDTARTISTSLRWRLTGEQLQEDLLGWATFLDDELWGHRMREVLDLDRLDLEPMGRGSPIADRVLVGGIPDPLSDSRLPGLVLEARRYRRCEGINVSAADGSWRLALVPGETVCMKVGATVIESMEREAATCMAHLVARGGILADLFDLRDVAKVSPIATTPGSDSRNVG